MSSRLEGISSLYLDSNILIYLLEGEASLRELVLLAFREVEAGKISLYTSDITITECLNGAFRANLDELAKHYLELFDAHDFITLLPVDQDVCIEATRLGATYRLKTVDAIHLASATRAGCQALLSNDNGFHSTKHIEAIQLSDFASQ